MVADSVDSQLKRRGVAQWFRIDTPGSYSFSVNPATHSAHGGDNGITYRVYTADELSKPMLPFKGEVVSVPAQKKCQGSGEIQDCWTVPAYQEAKFVPPNFPLFVKVFHGSRDYSESYTGRFRLLYHRATCTTLAEACDLVPYQADTFQTNSVASVAWYAFHVDRPDFLHQDLRLFVTENPGTPVDGVLNAVVLDAAGNPVLRNGIPMTLEPGIRQEDGLAEWSADDLIGTLEALVDPIHGGKFYLRVTRNPLTVGSFSIESRWTTNLTWLYGPALGGLPGDIGT